MRGRYLGGSGLGLGTGAQTGPPTHEKQRPAGSEVGAPATPAPRSQKEHPPEADETCRMFLRAPGCCLAGAGGGVLLASLRSGVWVSGLFCVQRDPVLKGRRLVNFANPWLLRLSGFQGFCCRSLAPGMATTWVRDHHLDFRTCPLFSVKRRVGEEMHGNLLGTWVGVIVGTWHGDPGSTTNPRKTKACWKRGRCAGEAGASIPKRTSAGGGENI